MTAELRQALANGIVIPAHPLALTANRQLDERRQRALTRYYIAAGAGGIAVGVHTTQFAIRDAKFALYRPVLELAAEEMRRASTRIVRIAGICGRTEQAVSEAGLARDLGYDAGLLSMSALRDDDIDAMIAHCRAVADVIPVVGFYLQPSVGGRLLPYSFWRKFVEIENVVGIKIAPFNRYQTWDVIRAVIESERQDIALYTGNDDNIVADLLTAFGTSNAPRFIAGGLLGHWSVWTRAAVELLEQCKRARAAAWPKTAMSANASRSDGGAIAMDNPVATPGIAQLLRVGVEVTDCNAAFFDAANGFRGCIAGLHDVLRRQGLFEGIWCLDEQEQLSPGQSEALDRVYRAYPHLNDDAFVEEHRATWLSG
jgi:dihydrodipicolinate synthase/N-acetylneuraminate lyase